jgi:branched-chain amino acid transport system ATP-binding protein
MTTTEVSPGHQAETSASDDILTLRNVEVVYNETSLAVRGVSLSVPRGSVVALLGANGAGKTTTIRAISGLLDIHDGRMREGDITLDGESIKRMTPHALVARGIAQVPEGRQVFGQLTVEENLRVGASALKDHNVKESLETIYELFPQLADRRRMVVGWMSGGEQQMVAVGRALMARPKLLLLDELSLGLAPQVIETIFERLRSVRAELNTAMLMVEQNAKLAFEFCDYGYIMENGRIVLDGPSAELLGNADVQEFYLGVGADHETRNYASIKHYKRRKRWMQ